jgi:hypothetical protein
MAWHQSILNSARRVSAGRSRFLAGGIIALACLLLVG